MFCVSFHLDAVVQLLGEVAQGEGRQEADEGPEGDPSVGALYATGEEEEDAESAQDGGEPFLVFHKIKI